MESTVFMLFKTYVNVDVVFIQYHVENLNTGHGG